MIVAPLDDNIAPLDDNVGVRERLGWQQTASTVNHFCNYCYNNDSSKQAGEQVSCHLCAVLTVLTTKTRDSTPQNPPVRRRVSCHVLRSCLLLSTCRHTSSGCRDLPRRGKNQKRGRGGEGALVWRAVPQLDKAGCQMDSQMLWRTVAASTHNFTCRLCIASSYIAG